MEPKCKRCGIKCPEIMPVSGPQAWGLDKDTFEPVCPACIQIMSLEYKIVQLTKIKDAIRCNIFADRPTLEEALAYAQAVADASGNPPAVLTAVYVVLNTLSVEMDKIINEWEG